MTVSRTADPVVDVMPCPGGSHLAIWGLIVKPHWSLKQQQQRYQQVSRLRRLLYLPAVHTCRCVYIQMWTSVLLGAVRANRCALMSQVATGVPVIRDSPP